MEFTPSPGFTIGMELELQLLDPSSLDLSDSIVRIMDLYPGSKHIKPEFIQNTVELASPVCQDLAELDRRMQALLAEIKNRCATLGLRLAGAGTHPFSTRLGLLTPIPRYERLGREHGHLAHTQITFATHVHIGLKSGNETIALMRDLKPYLPMLIALSANSPFWRGYDTGFAAYRHRILAASRSYGIPPSFDDWRAFSAFLATAERAGVFANVNEIHWDLRPRPHLGTIEVRVMDAQSTIDAAMAIAATVRFLISYLKSVPAEKRPEHLPKALPWWLERENYYQASRLGRQAQYIADTTGKVLPLPVVTEAALLALEPIAAKLDETDDYARLLDFSRAPAGCERQRAAFATRQQMNDVVADLVDRL